MKRIYIFDIDKGIKIRYKGTYSVVNFGVKIMEIIIKKE